MPTYTVHQPPPKKGETESAPERFLFVRDGFYFWAFVLAPLWLIVHRLWLVLLGYVLLNIAVGVGLALITAPSPAKFAVALLIALVVGFEAGSLWRWTLARRRWRTLGFVVAEDVETAERRFFGEWAKGAPRHKPEAPPQPHYSTPVRRGPPTGNDVIGLFPEPGAPR